MPTPSKPRPVGHSLQALGRRPLLRATLGTSASLALGALAGCGGPPNFTQRVKTPLDPAKIDADPIAVLPSGVVALATCDTRSLFGTSIGGDVANLVREIVPLGPESGFEVTRDVDRVTAGFYAMQGVDLCAVVTGRFDAAAIERAAAARTTSPSGKPIVATRYADQTLFTVGNLGFVVLTQQTALSGNETGMRRALDRLRYLDPAVGLTRMVPSWMTQLAETPNAAFSVAGDFTTTSAAQGASQTVPFLAGLKQARGVGNFQSPGVNVAATLTYGTEAEAEAGLGTIRNLASIGQVASLWTSWTMGASFPPVDARRSGAELGVTTAVDEGTSRALLQWIGNAARSAF